MLGGGQGGGKGGEGVEGLQREGGGGGRWSRGELCVSVCVCLPHGIRGLMHLFLWERDCFQLSQHEAHNITLSRSKHTPLPTEGDGIASSMFPSVLLSVSMQN